MDLTLPPAIPRRGGPITRAVGRAALRLLGWRIEGEFPNREKLVLIVAPHRSNWDFVVGISGKFALGLDVSWLGKHTLFRGPWGRLFKNWGGIPIDRRSSNDTVATVVGGFANRECLVLAITPEGTRKAVGTWRSGFWYIAHGAGIPILPVALDWEHRVVRILPPIEPRDRDEDMRNIQALYAGIRGRNGR
jgi:1-acyl-sn-glycerol-3-phosphate acyltransferase